ncbi:hypothetical protein HNP02_006682 [Mycobacterium sp. AZCC_0083]|nr:hypothetical protein [Mycobacterium sp. AZCC_0083]
MKLGHQPPLLSKDSPFMGLPHVSVAKNALYGRKP